MIGKNNYLLFQVGDEVFGTALISVREVIEYQEPKFMPNMVSFFSGVINIRGSIVGVVDLRKKFLQKSLFNSRLVMLISETSQGTIAAIVDRLDSVVEIHGTDIDTGPTAFSNVSENYLMGIAKVRNTFVTIVDLQRLLGEENLISQAS